MAWDIPPWRERSSKDGSRDREVRAASRVAGRPAGRRDTCGDWRLRRGCGWSRRLRGMVLDILGPLRRGRLAMSRSGQVFLRPDLLGYRSVSASARVSVGTEARRVRPRLACTPANGEDARQGVGQYLGRAA